MQLIVVRHGQTKMNTDGLVSGRTDIDITEVGVQQATETGIKLKGKPICRIIASPLIRAQHTAQIIAEQIGFDPAWIETDERLIEQDHGIYEGTIWAAPEFQAYRHTFAVRYPGGESKMDVAARVYSLLDELKATGGAPTLLVCHAGTCRALRTYFEDVGNEEYTTYFIDNACIWEFEL